MHNRVETWAVVSIAMRLRLCSIIPLNSFGKNLLRALSPPPSSRLLKEAQGGALGIHKDFYHIIVGR